MAELRIFLVLAIALVLLLPGTLNAQSIPVSVVHLSHSVLQPGQSQTLSVTARDLAGHALEGASVRATVRYGRLSQSFALLPTDGEGRTSLTFRPPSGLIRATGVVSISIRNGYLSIALTAKFFLGQAAKTSTRGRGPASPSPTSVPRTSPPADGRTNSIVVVARALPPTVTAPEPVWIMVYTENRSGVPASGARVDISAQFSEGTVDVVQSADSTGVATARIETSQVRSGEIVRVGVLVSSGPNSGSATSEFSVAPAPTPTLTPTLVPTPTFTPTPTVQPVAEVAAKPADTPTATPLIIPTATYTPLPTPTNTPIPTPTNTPTPTSSPTSVPTQGSAPAGSCASQTDCMQAMLGIINTTRAQYGAAPLTLNMTESNGTGSCVGSYGHSVHMQKVGYISHDQFPADICVPATMEAENVGMWQGDELQALQSIHNLMMGESYTPGCIGTHVCNILSTKFRQVGIGIYYVNNTAWLTEDFLG